MRHKIITPIIIFTLLVGALFYAASGRTYRHIIDSESLFAAPQKKSGERRMVDMTADDSYLVDKGDSTIFILVGNFAAHHNGTVILADSAIRYSNQSFECFGNVLINQNQTYAYGDRAEYNRDNSTATLYSDLVKVVDGDAVMYSYNCTFNTADNIGYFSDGCYVEKGANLLEAKRGYYNTKTHNLIAVDKVEMRDESYLMTGDSVIFNTQTEDAQYFTNTNIWNNNDEYLYANAGTYTKARDLHHLTRDAYVLSPEREIWSDTIEYYRTEGHIIGRRNIQMDDTTQKVLGFSDYGEWWDEPGNALFTRRPSMINYDPEQPDSLYLAADTLWLYTIAVPAPDTSSADTTRRDGEGTTREDRSAQVDSTAMAGEEEIIEEVVPERGSEEVGMAAAAESLATDVIAEATDKDTNDNSSPRKGKRENKDNGTDNIERQKRNSGREVGAPLKRDTANREVAPEVQNRDAQGHPQGGEPAKREGDEVNKGNENNDGNNRDSVKLSTTDSLIDTLASDSVKVLTPKQLRYRAKMEKRRVRDSIRTAERTIRDSLKAIEQAERDSIKKINDSLLRIKIDTIIAERIARSSKLADEEAARLARIKKKADERYRRKIDKAKARALKRGKVYKGPEYTIDSLEADTTKRDTLREQRAMGDSLGMDSLGRDTLAQDSTRRDSIIAKPFPEDSTYKMIKAYRRVKMYRSDSQLVCDSLVLLNTDSIIRLYIDPVLWNEDNQIVSDSMAIHTERQRITKSHFMGNPIMAMEIDTMYYNQVKGKDMVATFTDGVVSRNDVIGNAQTIYYMQEEDNPEVTGLMYIESASITFYLADSQIDKIAYKQNPTYVIYPMDMIPETQDRNLKDFKWYGERRPARDSVFDREIRSSRREEVAAKQKPRFKITERINYDRRRLVENGVWEDRVDELTPEVIEWRNTRTSYNAQ